MGGWVLVGVHHMCMNYGHVSYTTQKIICLCGFIFWKIISIKIQIQNVAWRYNLITSFIHDWEINEDEWMSECKNDWKGRNTNIGGGAIWCVYFEFKAISEFKFLTLLVHATSCCYTESCYYESGDYQDYQYRDSCYKYKIVWWLSCFYNEIPEHW